MQRIINALQNSWNGLVYVTRHEAAFREEMLMFFVSVPVAALLADSVFEFVALTGSVILLMVVELLNTGIEAVCDALSHKYMDEIKVAKDCGSAAVLLSIVLAGSIWIFAILDKVGLIW